MGIKYGWLCCCLVLCALGRVDAQSNALLTFRDTLEVRYLDDKKFIFHKTLPKQTLFAISNFYGISIDDIFLLNPEIKEKGLTVGKLVKIDLPDAAIVKARAKGFYRWKHAPLAYKVAAGESIFKIGKSYFELPVDSIVAFSKKKGREVAEGEKLVVGWLSLRGIPDSLHVKSKEAKPAGSLVEKEKKARELFEKQVSPSTVAALQAKKTSNDVGAKDAGSKKDPIKPLPNKGEPKKEQHTVTDTTHALPQAQVPVPVIEYRDVQSQGVAFWSRSNSQNNDLYVLHRKAPINSYIEIYNPMKRKTTYAKVIDRIPDGTNPDVEVVLSPATAKMLGARDPKFFVKVKYKVKK